MQSFTASNRSENENKRRSFCFLVCSEGEKVKKHKHTLACNYMLFYNHTLACNYMLLCSYMLLSSVSWLHTHDCILLYSQSVNMEAVNTHKHTYTIHMKLEGIKFLKNLIV